MRSVSGDGGGSTRSGGSSGGHNGSHQQYSTPNLKFDRNTKDSAENVELKARIESLEKENRDLKRSVFDLSNRLGQLQWYVQRARSRPFHVSARSNDQVPSSGGDERKNSLGGNNSVASNGSNGSAGHKSNGGSSGKFGATGDSGTGVSLSQQQLEGLLRVGPGGAALPGESSMMNHLTGHHHHNVDPLKPPMQRPNLLSDSFACKFEFTEHSGAVYCVKWSPSGTMLASGSFDKHIVVRHLGNSSAAFASEGPDTDPSEELEQVKTICLPGHEQLISDLAWSLDGRKIVSGSFDHTVRLWDVERGTGFANLNRSRSDDSSPLTTNVSEDELYKKNANSSGGGSSSSNTSNSQNHSATTLANGKACQTGIHKVQGLVQTVATDRSEEPLYWCGTSKGELVGFDSRVANPVLSLYTSSDTISSGSSATSMINSLHIPFAAPYHILCGDSKGVLRSFDRKMNRWIDELTFANESACRPITHITSTYLHRGRKLLATNSYDNILRVYDRGILLQSYRKASPEPQPHATENDTSDVEKHNSEGRASTSLNGLHDQSNANISSPPPSFPCAYALTGHRNKNWPIKSSFYCGSLSVDHISSSATLLASGSASTSVYLFDLGDGGAATSIKLSGHSGRVYACCFDQSETATPVLASCSADSTVKLWSIRVPV